MIISICNIVFYFPFPIIIALLINELRSLRTKRAVQFMIYIPYFFFLGSSRNDFREHPFSIQRCGKPDFKCAGTGFDLLYGRSEMVPRGTDRFLYLETDGIWRGHLCGNPFHLDPQLYEAAAIDGCNNGNRYFILPFLPLNRRS